MEKVTLDVYYCEEDHDGDVIERHAIVEFAHYPGEEQTRWEPGSCAEIEVSSAEWADISKGLMTNAEYDKLDTFISNNQEEYLVACEESLLDRYESYQEAKAEEMREERLGL